MAAGQGTGRGGSREGAGRKTQVPTGEGETTRVTVALGGELLELLRARYPGLGDQDLVRAGLWAAAGQPKVAPV